MGRRHQAPRVSARRETPAGFPRRLGASPVTAFTARVIVDSYLRFPGVNIHDDAIVPGRRRICGLMICGSLACPSPRVFDEVTHPHPDPGVFARQAEDLRAELPRPGVCLPGSVGLTGAGLRLLRMFSTHLPFRRSPGNVPLPSHRQVAGDVARPAAR